MHRLKTVPGLILCVVGSGLLIWLAVRNGNQLAQTQRSIEEVGKTIRLRDEFSEQQLKLYKFALADDSEDLTMRDAEIRFAEFQQRESQLPDSDSTSVLIAAIPQASTRQSHEFGWRVYVPEGVSVELAAIQFRPNSDEDGVAGIDQFIEKLPSGESVIRAVWTGNIMHGSVVLSGARNDPSETGLTITVNEVSHEWCSECDGKVAGLTETEFASGQAILTKKSYANLLKVRALTFADLMLVIRHSRSSAE